MSREEIRIVKTILFVRFRRANIFSICCSTGEILLGCLGLLSHRSFVWFTSSNVTPFEMRCITHLWRSDGLALLGQTGNGPSLLLSSIYSQVFQVIIFFLLMFSPPKPHLHFLSLSYVATWPAPLHLSWFYRLHRSDAQYILGSISSTHFSAAFC
jgi:hypothetical protein